MANCFLLCSRIGCLFRLVPDFMDASFWDHSKTIFRQLVWWASAALSQSQNIRKQIEEIGKDGTKGCKNRTETVLFF